MANILILGGGLAGAVAAERLARLLDPAEHRITLVSRSRRFAFCALAGTGLTDESGFVRVDRTMRVLGAGRMYAAGDAVYFCGPKMGHTAVNQAGVAAENLAAGLEGRAPSARYEHELLLVVDAGNRDSVLLNKRLWEEGDRRVSWGLFRGWAKRAHERYWNAKHS